MQHLVDLPMQQAKEMLPAEEEQQQQYTPAVAAPEAEDVPLKPGASPRAPPEGGSPALLAFCFLGLQCSYPQPSHAVRARASA